MELIVFVPA